MDEIGHTWPFQHTSHHPLSGIYITHAYELYHTVLGSIVSRCISALLSTCGSVMVTASTPAMFYCCWLLHINYATIMIPACNFVFPRYSNWVWSSPHPCNWGDWWIQWYCSELSDNIPVSAVRIYSISTKLSVWWRWEVESRPLSSGVCGIIRFVVEISSNYGRT